MAKADQNHLRESRRQSERQQRQEQPFVPGASGNPEDNSPEAAEERALKRHGKTEKHTEEDVPTE